MTRRILLVKDKACISMLYVFGQTDKNEHLIGDMDKDKTHTQVCSSELKIKNTGCVFGRESNDLEGVQREDAETAFINLSVCNLEK